MTQLELLIQRLAEAEALYQEIQKRLEEDRRFLLAMGVRPLTRPEARGQSVGR